MRQMAHMRFLFVLSSLIGLAAALACDPGHSVTYENRTGHTLTVFWNGVRDFSLEPEEKRTYDKLQIFKSEAFEARDEAGRVVYSESLTWDELKKRKWRIVITENIPLANPSTPTQTPAVP
jgi:hypothetical protein